MAAHTPPLSDGILDSRGRQIPLALVTEWGEEFLWVVCPYCLGHHRHDLDPSRLTGRTRTPVCDPGLGRYQPCYPFEKQAQAEYSYRVDKERGLFTTVGVDLPSDDDGSEEDEADNEGGEAEEAGKDFQNRQTERGASKPDQAETLEELIERLNLGERESSKPASSNQIPKESMQDASFRQRLFNSHCVRNNMPGVESLLKTYKDDPFIKYRNKDGANCIAVAAALGHDKMVQFLHRNGGDLNNADRRGRTPLMEAALWGRLQVVSSLLERGADPHTRDRKGRNAYYYSRPSRTTARMREQHARHPQSGNAEAHRRLIAIKLQAFEPVTAAAAAAAASSAAMPSGGGRWVTQTVDGATQIGFYMPLTIYAVRTRYKTVARLDRGARFPAVSATSGWTDAPGDEHVRDSRLWRDRVLELCALLGYALPASRCDEYRLPGSYHASHAEKKLVAYYIDRHVVLPRAFYGEEDENLDRGLGPWTARDLRLQDLAALAPRIPTVRAHIQVSKPMCDDCERFMAYIWVVLGIPFTVEDR